MVSTHSTAATVTGGGVGGKKPKCMVTGGAGFLGRHLVSQLLAAGEYDVSVFDVRDFGDPRVTSIVGDLRKPQQVFDALNGMEVVFHVATAAPTGENATHKALMTDVNVGGTKMVILGCSMMGVPRLVYTSSASVVFEGKDLFDVDESTPYAARPMDFYTSTKIDGEKAVLAANNQDAGYGLPDLKVIALRPSGIFGEGDLLFVPTTVRNAQNGKLKYIIGDGKNQMDWTYVGNVAEAHLLADRALKAGRPVDGKAYFITNQDPRPFWGMIGDVCEGLGYARPATKLPFALIYVIALIFERVLLPLIRLFKPVVVDFSVNRILIATTNRTFSSAAATRDLGYVPTVSMDEALRKTLASFQHLSASVQGQKGEKVKKQ